MDSHVTIARRLLDQRLAVRELVQQVGPSPARGWVREIRTALRMSSYTLATRSGMSPTRVRAAEKAEIERTIRLKSLDRLAEAMDCQVFYVIVPKRSLEEMVWRQAYLRAAQELRQPASCDRSDQQPEIPDAMAARARSEELTARALQLLDHQKVWRDPPQEPHRR